MRITDLPIDIFILIALHLSTEDSIVSRRVSKAFYATFTDSSLNRRLLLRHYPRARETRLINNANDQAEVDWALQYENAAARYHHLKTGAPSWIERLPLARSLVAPKWARHYPVAPWQRHLQFEDRSVPFHYPDTLWAYDDGILIIPSAQMQQYVLYDLERRSSFQIDIESETKIVRRIRLKEKLLIVEWCEEEPYHQLNENEMVYRHFASAYDITLDVMTGEWALEFRFVH